MSQVAIEVLLDAKSLLKQGWCKGAFARDRHGSPVPTLSNRAVSFDVIGAVVRAASSHNAGWRLAADPLSESLENSIPSWQDDATLDEILAAIDETVATLRSRERDYE